ncbi:MAG: class I SAM-dependent methyltransferase [Chlamydiae bacterium]|nr:class I SAM-dependent methyltransferase [Chlamydiota bacterium]
MNQQNWNTITSDLLIHEYPIETPLDTQRIEKTKYETIWTFNEYRKECMGEAVVDDFIEKAKVLPSDIIIDFGCGTGRSARAIQASAGCHVLLVDFASNCLDPNISLPYIELNLSEPMNLYGDVGFCTDVLEHIPGTFLDKVISNIMYCTHRAFFMIALQPDRMGALIDEPLHLSVHPFEFWQDKFSAYRILSAAHSPDHAQFYVERR